MFNYIHLTFVKKKVRIHIKYRELHVVMRRQGLTHAYTQYETKERLPRSAKGIAEYLQLIGLRLSCDYSHSFQNNSMCFSKCLIPKNIVHSIYIKICMLVTCFIKLREIGYPNVL